MFPDTNALLAMIIFPTDRGGRPTLAGEVKELYDQGAFELILSQVTGEELRKVVARDLPEHRELVEHFLKPFEDQFTRWPTREEVDEVLPYCTDPDDTPIIAAAILSKPDVEPNNEHEEPQGTYIVLSNDFETFHTERAKELWARHEIQLESLYGLLCVFGKRERKDEQEQGASPAD